MAQGPLGPSFIAFQGPTYLLFLPSLTAQPSPTCASAKPLLSLPREMLPLWRAQARGVLYNVPTPLPQGDPPVGVSHPPYCHTGVLAPA